MANYITKYRRLLKRSLLCPGATKKAIAKQI